MSSCLLLRSSSSHRWTVCSASALPLADAQPDVQQEPESFASLRGHAIHYIAGALLYRALSGRYSQSTVLSGIESALVPKPGEYFKLDEDADGARIKVDGTMWHVAECYVSDTVTWLQQQSLDVQAIIIDYQFVTPLVRSTNEAQISINLSLTPDLMIFARQSQAHMVACIDLKTGTYPVATESNAQLMTYLAYSDEIAKQIDRVRRTAPQTDIKYACAIWQNKKMHWWSPDSEVLLDWRNNTIARVASDIALQDTTLMASREGCRHCKRQSHCVAYARMFGGS